MARRRLPAVALENAAWLLDCDPAALDALAFTINGRRVVALDELRRLGLNPTRVAARTKTAAPPPVSAAA